MAEIPTNSSEVSNTIQWMVSNRVMKMNDAKATMKVYEYYTYFKFACQLMMAHMRLENRKKLQTDFKQMRAIENEINNSEIHPASKEQAINKCHYEFADSHEYYIMDALPKIGLGRNLEEGAIDFEKTDIDALSLAVRQHTGLSKVIGDMKDKEKKGV